MSLKSLADKILSSQLRINIVTGMVTNIAAVAVTAISYPLYLHFLGYEKYGVWLILSTIMNIAQLSNLGLAPAVVKLVAEEYGRRNTHGIQSTLSSATAILIISGCMAFIMLILFRIQIINLFKLTDENARIALSLLPYMGLLTIYVFIVQVSSATLSGLGRMDLATYSDAGGRILISVLSLMLLYLGLDIRSMLIASALSYAIIHGVNVYLIHQLGDYSFYQTKNYNLQYVTKLLKIGSGMFGSSLINILVSPFNKIMISRFIGVSSVPIYEITYNSCMYIRSLVESGIKAISPEVSRVSAVISPDAIKRIQQLNKLSLKTILIIAAPLWIILMVFAAPILSTWLQNKYVGILPVVFRAMLIGVFMNLLAVPAFYILLGMGKTHQIFISYVVQSFANVMFVMSLIMINRLNIVNMAYAVMVSMAVASFYLVWQKRLLEKKLTDDMPPLSLLIKNQL
ncbi:MAG TPA: oligosaccharide flippase family protein [Nitrospirota bacterium]|nr:oligosaccharide flippase family protein [Nitrospirota bacterium]